MSDDTGKRIEELEAKLAFLEQASQELSDVVFAQQKAIDALTARVTRLLDRLAALEQRPDDVSPGDERPPHY